MLTISPDEVRAELGDDTPDPGDEKLTAKIKRAISLAGLYAPCIKSEKFARVDEAKALIIGALVYDLDSASRRHQSQGAGPFQVTEFAPRTSGTLYSPSQIEALGKLCGFAANRSAYSVQVGFPVQPEGGGLTRPWGVA